SCRRGRKGKAARVGRNPVLANRPTPVGRPCGSAVTLPVGEADGLRDDREDVEGDERWRIPAIAWRLCPVRRSQRISAMAMERIRMVRVGPGRLVLCDGSVLPGDSNRTCAIKRLYARHFRLLTRF